MQFLSGDLIENVTSGKIAHVCNDVPVWGAGFALALAKKYPKHEKAYLESIKKWKRDNGLPHRYGLLTVVESKDPDIVIYNIHAMKGMGTGTRQLTYVGLVKALELLPSGSEINIPYMMGCGLAGGNWKFVKEILVDIEQSLEIEFKIWKL